MTIAEVARTYEMTADTLRYYERIGLIPPVNRSRGGIRDYTESDCGWVAFIKCMRGAGIAVEALIEYVALYKSGEKTQAARKKILVEQRELLKTRIQEMQNSLERLNAKIEHYDDVIIPCETELLAKKGEQ